MTDSPDVSPHHKATKYNEQEEKDMEVTLNRIVVVILQKVSSS